MNNLKGKNILISSGGTREYIDDVRVITNISTGALGAKIAESFYHFGAKVHYVHGINSKMPVLEEGISEGTFNAYPVKTCKDMFETMKALIPAFKIDAVIHSAAVSDYTFKKEGEVKLSSDSAEDFIEFMKKTITPNPKIIKHIKEWNPNTLLVGFKFTVGKTEDELIKIAIDSGIKSTCDAVFANDKSMMSLNNDHVGYLVNLNDNVFKGKYVKYTGKNNISFAITDYVNIAFGK